MAPLRTVLRTPGVVPLLGASLVGRLPLGALSLLLLLRARELGLSYAVGGAAAGAMGLGLAAGAPVLGRLADARGQRPVLVPAALVSAVVLLALASPAASTAAALVALSFVAGLLHPPLSSCLRALWPHVLPDGRLRHAVLSVESSLLEITYLLGPLVLVGVLAAASVALALAASATVLVVGTAAYVAQPAARAAGAGGGAMRGSAVRSGAVRTLVGIQAAIGCSFGALEVAVTAFAGEHGHQSATGPLLAVWGLGSLVGGLVAAQRGVPADPAARLAALLGGIAALDALLLAAPGPGLLAVGLLVAGAGIAPSFALLYGLVADAAPPGAATEAQAWLTTGIGTGVAAGAAAAGALVDGPGPSAAFLLAVVGAALAAAITTLRAPTLLPSQV